MAQRDSPEPSTAFLIGGDRVSRSFLLRQVGGEHSSDVAAQHLGYVLFGQTGFEQGIGDHRQPCRVERRNDGAVKIGAEADVLNPCDRYDMQRGGNDACRTCIANGSLPVVDTHDPTGLGDLAYLRIR